MPPRFPRKNPGNGVPTGWARFIQDEHRKAGEQVIEEAVPGQVEMGVHLRSPVPRKAPVRHHTAELRNASGSVTGVFMRANSPERLRDRRVVMHPENLFVEERADCLTVREGRLSISRLSLPPMTCRSYMEKWEISRAIRVPSSPFVPAEPSR
jgi:hypothetical protein